MLKDRRDILPAKELFIIKNKNKIAYFFILILIILSLICTFVYFNFIASSNLFIVNMNYLNISLILLSMLIIIALFLLYPQDFIITEKGVKYKWSTIPFKRLAYYRWAQYSGRNRLTILKKRVIGLQLFKRLTSNKVQPFGLAQMGYHFKADFIKEIDNIFSTYGVRKIKSLQEIRENIRATAYFIEAEPYEDAYDKK